MGSLLRWEAWLVLYYVVCTYVVHVVHVVSASFVFLAHVFEWK